MARSVKYRTYIIKRGARQTMLFIHLFFLGANGMDETGFNVPDPAGINPTYTHITTLLNASV